MADQITVDNALLDDYTVSTDDAGALGQVQRVKLATSGDGEATHVPADLTNGLDVDVTRVTPGTTSTNLGKAEDAPAVSGDTGVLVLAVRRDSAASGVSADGDYAALSVASDGSLRVTTIGGGGGTEFAEDSAHTSGDHGSLLLAIRHDAGGSMVSTDGDYAGLQVDALGRLIVTGADDLYGPTEYTTDDALPTNPTGPLVMTRKLTTPAATAPADNDAQGLRSTSTGALWAALDLVNHPMGAATVKRAFANVTTGQTDSVVVAAVTGKKLRVLQAVLVAGATAQPITFNSKGAGAGTAISPLIANAANGGEVLPFSPLGWIETNSGEALTATTPGSGSTTGVLIAYIEV